MTQAVGCAAQPTVQTFHPFSSTLRNLLVFDVEVPGNYKLRLFGAQSYVNSTALCNPRNAKNVVINFCQRLLELTVWCDQRELIVKCYSAEPLMLKLKQLDLKTR